MPRIFDNIDLGLLPALEQTLSTSSRADFCVGYFNLRGWKTIDSVVAQWPGGPGSQCRLLVGMQRLPQDELRQAYSLRPTEDEISNQAVIRLKLRPAQEFRNQLSFGAPTDEDEAGLRRLAAQLEAGQLVVKLFVRHPLHAKLYLCFRSDPDSPRVGYPNRFQRRPRRQALLRPVPQRTRRLSQVYHRHPRHGRPRMVRLCHAQPFDVRVLCPA